VVVEQLIRQYTALLPPVITEISTGNDDHWDKYNMVCYGFDTMYIAQYCGKIPSCIIWKNSVRTPKVVDFSQDDPCNQDNSQLGVYGLGKENPRQFVVSTSLWLKM
jgi:hypothetical protein